MQEDASVEPVMYPAAPQATFESVDAAAEFGVVGHWQGTIKVHWQGGGGGEARGTCKHKL
jgi:hypothetical protein